jgi:hypothetical protein
MVTREKKPIGKGKEYEKEEVHLNNKIKHVYII